MDMYECGFLMGEIDEMSTKSHQKSYYAFIFVNVRITLFHKCVK